MSNRSLLPPRDDILETMDRIYRFGMTTTSGGNVSVRDQQGDVWITPARIDKGNLRRMDIVCVGPGEICTGLHPPSSEFPFHRAIYNVRDDVLAIVHAHPVALVAFSMTRQIPDTRIFPQAHHVCGEVGFAPYALPGSAALARNIADTFAQGYHCVVLENHGVVVVGATLSQAFQRFEALEFAARTLIQARLLGEPRFLTDEQLEQSRNRRIDFTPQAFPPAGTCEKERRQQLCEFVRRGCQQRLLISTEGSFSARLDGESFLITPSQQDRYRLGLDDIVLVRGATCEPNKTPSRASRAHQAIYRQHPQVQAIAFAHPVNATAFSVTAGTVDARTIPESYIFLRDVQRVLYGEQYLVGSDLADRISLDQPAAIIENDGVLVVGTSVLDAFDRLEVLEATAAALVSGRHLGSIAPMSSAVIDELRQAFFPR